MATAALLKVKKEKGKERQGSAILFRDLTPMTFRHTTKPHLLWDVPPHLKKTSLRTQPLVHGSLETFKTIAAEGSWSQWFKHPSLSLFY